MRFPSVPAKVSRLAAGLLLATIPLAGCNNPLQSAPAAPKAPQGTFPPTDATKDQAIANKLLVTKDDLPAGYAEDPSPWDTPPWVNPNTPSCSKLKDNNVLNILADDAIFTAHTDNEKTFKSGENVFATSITSSAVMFRTAVDKAKWLAATQDPRTQTCIQDSAKSGPSSSLTASGTKAETIKPVATNNSIGERFVYTEQQYGGPVNVYFDEIIVCVDRASVEVDYTQLDAKPAPSQDRDMLTLANKKLQQVLAAPPGVA